MNVDILVDHNIEGQAIMLAGTYKLEGWLELLPLSFLRFNEVGLSSDSSDRIVWHFAQKNEMLLLTNNRNMKDEDSLERTLREENKATSLPILTIGNVDRVICATYREKCVTRLAEIVSELEEYLGTGRLFIP